MSYKRPGVETIQEFQAGVPALSTPDLPSVIFGPAYQIVNNNNVGNYVGINTIYPYQSLLPAAIVDLKLEDEEDLIDFPVTINIKNARIEFIAPRTTGETTKDSKIFEDDTTANAFENVEIGDKLILLSGDDAGEYTITAIDESDTSVITLNSELSKTSININYKIERLVSIINIPRSTVGVIVDEDGVELPDALTYNGYDIVTGAVYLNYRALRTDLPVLQNYSDFTSLEAVFGIGNIVPENPLAYGINIAHGNTTTKIGGLALTSDYISDEVVAYTKALDKLKSAKLEGTDIYSLVGLTQNTTVHQLIDAHVSLYSQSDKKRERIGFINRKLKTILDITEEITTNGFFAVTPARANVGESFGTNKFQDITTPNAFIDVMVGDILRIVEGGADDGDHVIIAKSIYNNEVTLSQALTLTALNIDYQVLRNDGLWGDGETFYDSNALFISDGVAAGHYLDVDSATGVGTFAGRYLISEVNSQKKLKLASPVLGAPYKTVKYKVDRDYTLDEQAQFIADYATAFANRRLCLVWPDVVKADVGGTVRKLPAYFLSCALSAMVSGLPPHQGFTNLTVVGFIGREHGGDYFDSDLLDVIAGGGTLICDHDTEEAPLYVRHQLTTDLSSIAFQELSITKNLDNMCKTIRKTFLPYIGPYNITNSLITVLQGISTTLITYFKEQTIVEKLGAQLRDGTLESLTESTIQPDTLESEWNFSLPYPLNNLKIKIRI
jgi:hypothetical protein